MANDTHLPLSGYAIWLLASDDDHDNLQDIIDDLSRAAGSRRFAVHTTLIGLLDYTSESENRLIKSTEALAASATPMETELTGVGMRDTHFQAVFLHLVPNVQLMKLNQAARLLFGHRNSPPFMPHISVLYGDVDGEHKAKAARTITAYLSFPHVVTLDRLALVRVDGHPDEWEIRYEFPFTK